MDLRDIHYAFMARYSLFVLRMPLRTKQTLRSSYTNKSVFLFLSQFINKHIIVVLQVHFPSVL